MTRGLYLRADGRLPCYCSSGETLTLGRLDHEHLPGNIAADIFESPAFTRKHAAMAENKVPFPGICEQCTYLDVDAALPDGTDRILEWLHLEPAYFCNLDCRWCHGQTRREPGGVRMLPLNSVHRLADDFSAQGYHLDKGNICGVGEPTLHPKVWEMIDVLKKRLGGDILLSTNGNGPFSPAIVECGLDKLKIAADAVTQEAYARYRTHGSLAKVLDFTAKVAADKARSGATGPLIIWQYILFDYNDSDADLLLYQKMAREHGVDRLRIVYTRCDNYSRRSPNDFPHDFPDIQFLPIKDDSLIDAEEARNRFAEIADLATSSDTMAEAARLGIGLSNRIFHRLLLGVERYVDLLAFVRTVKPIAHGNLADLASQDVAAFRALLGGIFRLLADIRRGQGDIAQADAYRTFLRTAGL
jgi:wyosine [tRNA(Phe)-imidazoG37] synthetase (radical SAM superfamily)